MLQLIQNFFEPAGFDAAARRFGVAVHWIGTPKDLFPLAPQCLGKKGKAARHFGSTEPENEREATRFVLRVQDIS